MDLFHDLSSPPVKKVETDKTCPLVTSRWRHAGYVCFTSRKKCHCLLLYSMWFWTWPPCPCLGRLQRTYSLDPSNAAFYWHCIPIQHLVFMAFSFYDARSLTSFADLPPLGLMLRVRRWQVQYHTCTTHNQLFYFWTSKLAILVQTFQNKAFLNSEKACQKNSDIPYKQPQNFLLSRITVISFKQLTPLWRIHKPDALR